jgi:hypothetical protein
MKSEENVMENSTKLLFLNEIRVEKETVHKIIEKWHLIADKNLKNSYCLYVSESDVLEISSQNKGFDWEKAIKDSPLLSLEEKLKHSLLSDWKRQILTLKDTVKPQNCELPITPFIQLRHIEVPLKVYNDYTSWRKRTIFEYIKENSKVDSFLAYHSLLSTEPGVTFFSGFSCETKDYLDSFNTPEYQKIVKEAGSQFICGGEKSLYTKIYRKG